MHLPLVSDALNAHEKPRSEKPGAGGPCDGISLLTSFPCFRRALQSVTGSWFQSIWPCPCRVQDVPGV
ncbi:hypothetical protein AK812_SmicGene28438 [Symbiodinium microadriaticum]|uniref:Uncharacterized protein n=1 Tax=Symbiodinium microadriaticum TaxID=2951 RepID=A0A1Q9D4F7_SYMMI|nr:hypothetical protein AK812_SmicGene28438 [Symbiodinium microadriaticum]CAE7720654.1 unnamed protein product [Symbiodinium sp. KB8]